MKSIIKYPNKILLEKAELVKEVNKEINKHIDDMLETMLTLGALGLSAPQIGISKRIIVAKPEEDLIILVNPEIIESEDEQMSKEGCLSLPGANPTIKRSLSIKVKGLDRKGKEIELNLAGLAAAVIEHEIDHLDGKTLLQRVNLIQRKQILSQMKKHSRNAKRIKKTTIRKS